MDRSLQKRSIPSDRISDHGGVSTSSRRVNTQVDEDVLKELEREGISPSQVSREAVEAVAARVRRKRTLGVLKKEAHKLPLIFLISFLHSQTDLEHRSMPSSP